ncbi:MAG TPA: hypothetical protein VMC83_03160 [Streptosporangiaceae bacterium]|nr:hypothetical protein [Streptosporangiaceae bacterium]
MADIHNEENDIDQLWRWVAHEDDLLASRVSFFLLAQSILIAVTASLVNTVADLSHTAEPSLRPEVFGLAVAITLAGVALTLVFWYVFWLNFLSVGFAMDELTAIMNRRKTDNFRARIHAIRVQRRNANWFFRIVFRKRGMNWMITNVLPMIILFLWCIVGVFDIVVFSSH